MCLKRIDTGKPGPKSKQIHSVYHEGDDAWGREKANDSECCYKNAFAGTLSGKTNKLSFADSDSSIQYIWVYINT